MPAGTCRLCGEDKDLKSSHFIPAAFYKIARKSDPTGENPVVVTKDIVMQTSKQAQIHLLCGDCEDRFNKGGETWVLANCWQADGTFPLRDALLVTSPAYETPGFRIFATKGIAGIDQGKLAFFAASIFWRASVHDWHLVGSNPAIDLGPYQEALRLFLLGGDSPADVVMTISVSAEQDVRAAAMGIFPYLKNHNTNCRQFNFTMNGLTFDLFVGKSMDASRRGMCIIRSATQVVFMANSMDSQVVHEFGTMMSTAKPVGKLAK
jgi:hypothetical protein